MKFQEKKPRKFTNHATVINIFVFFFLLNGIKHITSQDELAFFYPDHPSYSKGMVWRRITKLPVHETIYIRTG